MRTGGGRGLFDIAENGMTGRALAEDWQRIVLADATAREVPWPAWASGADRALPSAAAGAALGAARRRYQRPALLKVMALVSAGRRRAGAVGIFGAVASGNYESAGMLAGIGRC